MGEEKATLGAILAENGWGTGAVLRHAFVRGHRAHFVHGPEDPPCVDEGDWYVVLSQSCDVLVPNDSAEPFVEVLRCHTIPKLRPQYKELRSTRVLDFKPNAGTCPGLVLTTHATQDRFLIPRVLFRSVFPDDHLRLDNVAVRRLLAWMALRYSRPAWPDNFVQRLSPVKKRLLEILSPLKDDVAEVRVAIEPNDRDVLESEVYSVAVFFVVDEEVWLYDEENRRVIQSAFANFISAIDSLAGIDVNGESAVLSGAEFTWQLAQMTDEWNFANLSEREST